jgi:hypothetical protein
MPLPVRTPATRAAIARYAVRHVAGTLLAGACQQAADYNRAHMMRIAPDRLPHTFRLDYTESLRATDLPRHGFRGRRYAETPESVMGGDRRLTGLLS